MNQIYNESHIRNLILMAKSDDHVDDTELEIIFKIGKERGFTEQEINYFLKDETSFKIIQPKEIEECFEQLYDLALVMMADGIIEDDEMDFCTEFAEELGLESKEASFIVMSIVEGLENNFAKTTIYQTSRKFLEELEDDE